jgi:RimJ/RimL family protein N-acetyltransferase
VSARDGRAVRIRPTRTSDVPALQELFHHLTEEDVRTRFFQKLESLTDTAAQHLCSVDYEEEMAFAAVVGRRERERIVATSSYYLNPANGMAEVAYLVDPEWQGLGLARTLQERMIEYGRAHGVRGFVADCLTTNRAMLRVFERSGLDVTVRPAEAGVREVRMRFAEPAG